MKRDRIVKCLEQLVPVKSTWKKLVTVKGSPETKAGGFALGIFISMTPLIGLQFILALVLASFFKLNKIAAGIGVFNTNFFTGPFMFAGAYIIGARVMGLTDKIDITGMNLSFIMDLVSSGPHILLALTLGGFIIGIPMAFASYYITMYALKKICITPVV